VTGSELIAKLRDSLASPLPFPGSGQTPRRHRCLLEIARTNLSLARLAEAHWDAVAILAEAGRSAVMDQIYGVWAAEKPGKCLLLERTGADYIVSGQKWFCSGAGLVDRALVTVGGPESRLIEINLSKNMNTIKFDDSSWKTAAFEETHTSVAIFSRTPIRVEDVIGDPDWYISRAGFWHGACGPASCWAGGAIGLFDFALQQQRSDPHTLAHLAAMRADAWGMNSVLDFAGREIDEDPFDIPAAQIRALSVRHLVEQACTDIIRRLPRAYGPHPLAMDKEISRRYLELDLYLRQCHAERDLESLGRMLIALRLP
jgi:alkylation response protein AidB-like acyl-CoA dehydrogenase